MKPLKTLPILYNGTHCYNIELQTSFEGLADSLKELEMLSRRVCIVTDSNVEALYGAGIQNILALSIRMYVAEASIILASVAISDKSGFVKQMITADKIR